MSGPARQETAGFVFIGEENVGKYDPAKQDPHPAAEKRDFK